GEPPVLPEPSERCGTKVQTHPSCSRRPRNCIRPVGPGATPGVVLQLLFLGRISQLDGRPAQIFTRIARCRTPGRRLRGCIGARNYGREVTLTVTVAVPLAPPSIATPSSEYWPGIVKVATVSALPFATGVVAGLNDTRPPAGPRYCSQATRSSGPRGGLPPRAGPRFGIPSAVTGAPTPAPAAD